MQDYAPLEALAAVIREGSFERAAATLGVTPSAISQRIRALEDRLGAVLIRRGQPCVATPIGTRLCAHVEQVRLLEGELANALPAIAGASPDGMARNRQTPLIRIAVNADSLATWFLPAIASFCETGEVLVDVTLEGEDQTAERLRTGDVLAAVTTDAQPVQGCRTIPLGSLRYVAVASPRFVEQWFPTGITADTLSVAPVLRFDRNDQLQARWVETTLDIKLSAPTHWLPSTHAFMDGAVAGLGWAMNPLSLVRHHLDAGRLVELIPRAALDVPLHWQYARLGTTLLDRLTRAVIAAARQNLAC